jgi:glycosyltransferase involved in cell wall biosynthesis
MKNKYQILLPVYNCEKTIERTIESVLNQTFLTEDNYKNVVLTIVNNNCSDSTVSKIQDMGNQIVSKLEYEILNCNIKGIVPALNTGLYNSRYSEFNFVARIDGDDIWYPAKLEKQNEFLINNPDIKVLGTQIRAVHKETYQPTSQQIQRPTEDSEIKQWLFNSANPIAHPSVVFNKEILLKTGGYDDFFPIAEDYVLWLKAARWFNFANLSDTLIDYTVSHNPFYDPKIPQTACQFYKILYKQLGQR